MFVKYFDLIKNLFDNVFRNNGNEVNFIDYLYILGYTFALIGVLIVLICVFTGIIALPIFVHKKVIKKDRVKMKELQLQIIKEEKPTEVFKISKMISNIDRNIVKRNICFVVGIIFLYVPFIIPTALFIISKILELF